MISNDRSFRQSRCALALIVLLSPWLGRAQEVTARLAGTVKDQAGAVVPEAALSATHISTGVVTRTTSDASGDYIFLQLAPGTYTLSVEKTGFASSVISGISLNVDQKASVDGLCTRPLVHRFQFSYACAGIMIGRINARC